MTWRTKRAKLHVISVNTDCNWQVQSMGQIDIKGQNLKWCYYLTSRQLLKIYFYTVMTQTIEIYIGMNELSIMET